MPDSVVLEKVFDDIDESFHNVIFEKIRTEVKSQLTPLLSEILKDASFMNEVKSTKQVNINYDNDAYVNVLKEIISHLNEQITKEDNVIELLINKISTVKNVESFNASNDVNMQDMDNDVFFNIDEKQTVNTANNINVNKQRKYKTKKDIKDAIIIQDNNKGENILTNVVQEVSNIPLSNLRETLGNNENNTKTTDDFIRVTNNRKKKKDRNRVVTILGDSIVKDLKPWKMSKKTGRK